MATKCKKGSNGQIDEVDRVSDLPEYILHHILSFMGTKEACRTCILSKKWSSVWDTVPFLDFQFDYFVEEKLELQDSSSSDSEEDDYDMDSVDRCVNFIDRTMQRYSQQNLSIQKLTLELPVLDYRLASLVDSWLRIAVENHLEELNLGLPDYRLPEILFSAKSLKILSCFGVELPNYQVVRLTSLRTLKLIIGNAHEGMLQRIISSCPLIDLELNRCSGIANIVVPRLSKLECLRVERFDIANLDIQQETGSLRIFVLSAGRVSWPCKINAGALRNLKELEIYFSSMVDEVFLNLLNEITLVDTLKLCYCDNIRNLNITSNRLKELCIKSSGLENVVIDAPNLTLFSYIGYHRGLSLSSANIGPHCEAFLKIAIESDTDWFITLKEFLNKSNIFKVLNILLPCNASMNVIDLDKVRKTLLVGPAYELRELKLCLTSNTSNWRPTQSYLTAFLDVLFMICRPVVLCVSTFLQYDNNLVKLLVNILQKKAKSQHHPLRGVQVESIDCPSKLDNDSRDEDLNFNIRLWW